ncbi:MAG: hypothetical protein ABJA98_25540 [Acidobacteriota bacterium]
MLRRPPSTLEPMTFTPLGEFISAHRDEVLLRCREKVCNRSIPLSAEADLRGVPLFLDDLVDQLKGHSPSTTKRLGTAATQHGSDLFLSGYTVGQVVHDYGNVCQAVTDLAVESAAVISSDDFRTLNRCLDDGIASALVEFSRQQQFVAADDGIQQSMRLRNLVETAISGFEVLQSGKIGVGGTTGAMVYRSLLALRVIA